MTEVYWCPPHEGSTALRLGVIKTVRGQKMDGEMYLSFLGERIQELLEQAESPERALASLVRALEEAGLAPAHPEEMSEAGATLIWSNPLMLDYLATKGLYPERDEVKGPTPGAREVYEETTLDEWATLVGPDRELV